MMGSLRRSDQLDRLLDRLLAGEEPEATGDLAPYLHPAQVARASLSRTLTEPVARAQLALLREDRARTIVVVPPARRTGLRVAAAGVVAAIVLVLGAGSAIAAAQGALPGDPLYGVKRAAERISLAMHLDAVGRASLHLRLAQRRLDEIQTLIAEGKDAGSTVEAFDSELNAAEQDAEHAVALGQDEGALLAHVEDMIAKHIAVLNGVLGKVPDQAKGAIQHAIDNAQNAEQKAQHGRTQDRNNGNAGSHGRPTAPPGRPDHVTNR